MRRVLIISTPFRGAAVVEFDDARKFPLRRRFSGPVVASLPNLSGIKNNPFPVYV